jgi:hypothetical protein
MLGLLALSRRQRRSLLLTRMEEDPRAVLMTEVQALAIARRRVMDLQKRSSSPP